MEPFFICQGKGHDRFQKKISKQSVKIACLFYQVRNLGGVAME